MKTLLRKLFRKSLFEKPLVFLLGTSCNKLLQFLVSPNTAYPANSFRSCKRYGINYYLDISDYQNWLLYFYNTADSSFGILNYIDNAGCVLDVGGNIGQTALMMALHTKPRSLIYSFEPYPETYKKFKKNIELNKHLETKIHLQQLALGRQTGLLNMYEDCASNSGANRINPAEAAVAGKMTQVPVSTIDIFAKQNRLSKIDFIKIDVEGFEMEVLKGCHETLTGSKPSLFIEIDNGNLEKQGSSAVKLCTYLKALGYRIYEEGKKIELDFYHISKPLNIYCR